MKPKRRWKRRLRCLRWRLIRKAPSKLPWLNYDTGSQRLTSGKRLSPSDYSFSFGHWGEQYHLRGVPHTFINISNRDQAQRIQKQSKPPCWWLCPESTPEMEFWCHYVLGQGLRPLKASASPLFFFFQILYFKIHEFFLKKSNWYFKLYACLETTYTMPNHFNSSRPRESMFFLFLIILIK